MNKIEIIYYKTTIGTSPKGKVVTVYEWAIIEAGGQMVAYKILGRDAIILDIELALAAIEKEGIENNKEIYNEILKQKGRQ